MAESRSVIYHFDAVQFNELVRGTDAMAAFEALGYLSTWNYTFPHCDIYITHGFEFTAVFREAPNAKPGYVIGAIWDGDDCNFTFHS